MPVCVCVCRDVILPCPIRFEEIVLTTKPALKHYQPPLLSCFDWSSPTPPEPPSPATAVHLKPPRSTHGKMWADSQEFHGNWMQFSNSSNCHVPTPSIQLLVFSFPLINTCNFPWCLPTNTREYGCTCFCSSFGWRKHNSSNSQTSSRLVITYLNLLKQLHIGIPKNKRTNKKYQYIS